jgi:thioredoxin-like negative regulator of GroEL
VEKLRPLAQFLFDIENGDALTGIDPLDDAYLDVAKALHKRKPSAALEHLFTALDVGETMDQAYITKVIHGLFALLGENHKLSRQYASRLDQF